MTNRGDSRLPDRRKDGIAIAVLLLLFLVQWSRFVFSDRMFYFRDLSFFSAPLLVEVAQQWRGGHFPSWNPRLACGTPLAADPNSGAFMPDSWIVPLFGGWLGGVKVLLLARLLFIPLAAYVAMRALRIRPPGAFLTAAAAALSGPVATTLSSFPAHLAGAAVLLPLAACAVRLSSPDEPNRTAFAASALLFTFAVMAGSPELAAQGALVFLVCAAARPWPRSLGRALLALFCGSVIAAPLWLPAAGLYPRTPRALGWKLAEAPGLLSFSPLRLLEFLWPSLLGDPTSPRAPEYWGRALTGGLTPYLLSVAVGLVPWILLPLALRHPVGRRLAVAAAVCTAYSFGQFLPGASLLLRTPIFSTLRYPEKWQIGATLGLAGIAGIGLEELRRALPDGLRGPRAVAAGALAASATLAVFVFVAPAPTLRALRAGRLLDPALPAGVEQTVRGVLQREALAGVAVSGAVLAALWLARDPRFASALPPVLIGLLVAERLPRVIGAVPATTLDWFRQQRLTVEPVLREQAGGRFYYDHEATNATEALRPFTGTLYGLYYAGNTDIDQFSDARGRGFAEIVQSLSFADDRKIGLLRLANVRVVDTDDPAAAARPELEAFLDRADGRRCYRLRGSSPARLFSEVHGFAEPIRALGDLVSPGFSMESAGTVEGVASFGAAASEPAPHSVGPMRWLGPSEFEIELETARPAWLQVSVTYDPNWRLDVDGNDAPPWPTDFLFLGIPVPPGRHLVRGRYAEPRFALGAVLAVTMLAGLSFAVRRGSPIR